jgi:hypothetical protein
MPRLSNRNSSLSTYTLDGAVITGGLDGRLLIFNSDSGELLFQYDTVTDFEIVNAVEGYGGSIDSHSIAAGSGMVVVGCGLWVPDMVSSARCPVSCCWLSNLRNKAILDRLLIKKKPE